MNLLELNDLIKEDEKRIRFPEQILGKGLNQVFNPNNSSPRKIMLSVHSEHNLPLLYPEPPLIGTGYENKFGDKSSALVKTENNLTVLSRIDKFSNAPKKHHYFLLVKDDNGVLDVIERIGYKHKSETYGYLKNNTYLDSLRIGAKIPKGSTIEKSLSFDENNNRAEGVNLMTMYLASEKTKEDSIILSQDAADKLVSPLIKKVTIVVNDNDILLNLYGNDDEYKTFPDIGEEVQGKILCAVRREQKEESLFTQSYQKLKTIIMSDEKYPVDGKVIDIDIYCNNPEKIDQNFYNSQLNKYYQDKMRFGRELVHQVDTLMKENPHFKMSYNLNKLYSRNKEMIEGSQFLLDRPFSNIMVDIYLLEENTIKIGDKLSDRYGGKGVISQIRPKELMPRLDNGQYVDIIFNMCTCVNRLNPGQLFEVSLNHIAQRIIDYIINNSCNTLEALNLYKNFLYHVSPEQARFVEQILMNAKPEELDEYLLSIFNQGIRVSLKPISDNMGIDKIDAIYKDFANIAKPYTITVPVIDSNGNVRYINSRRTLPCGKKYIYRLKQYAEEKFSVTSLSSTNIRNENSRNNASKYFKGLYKKTPLRFGEMETADMAHIGMEVVIINMMLNSVSPLGRRQMEALLTGDPYNVDIKLTDECTNRNAQIVDVYLKVLGLRLVFIKRPKKIQKGIIYDGIKKCIPIRRPGLIAVNPRESYHNDNYINEAIEFEKNRKVKPGLIFDGITYD